MLYMHISDVAKTDPKEIRNRMGVRDARAGRMRTLPTNTLNIRQLIEYEGRNEIAPISRRGRKANAVCLVGERGVLFFRYDSTEIINTRFRV
jgi:hypothetical protein